MKMNNSGNNKKKNHQPVKVYVRQRPFSEREIEMHCPNIIQHLTNTELVIKLGLHEKRYGFDQVFSEETSQKEIYDTVVAPLIDFMILGYNCTVFAYGQTGTGKTFTMIGNKVILTEEPSSGLIPRSVCHLFKELDRINSNVEYTVRVSFIEIYNEEVRDLLSSTGGQVKIFDDGDKGSVCLKGVKEETVFSVEEALSFLNIGVMERQTANTAMNRHSSRSHSIFVLSLLTRQLTVDGEELIKAGKLYMVDLAGSENIGRSGSTDIRIREAGNINKSLLTLGKVIKALAQNAQHVPYRDSKLTRILRDSLGGRTKTCMIATISAAANVWDETISTLDYAQVARNVSNCPQVNENRKRAIILKDLKDEIARLRKELAVARAGEGFFMCKESYEKLCNDLKESQNETLETKKKVSELIRANQILELENCSSKEQLEKLTAGYEEVKRELDEKSLQAKRTEFALEHLGKHFNDLFKSDFFGPQKDDIEDLEHFNQKKMQEIEVMSSRCMNALKQVFNDYFLCVNDIVSTHGTFIKKVKTTLEDSEINWRNTVKENSSKLVRSVLEEIGNKVDRHSNKQEVGDIRNQFIKESENRNNVKKFKTGQSYEVKKVGEPMEKFRKEDKENVQFVSRHSNETYCNSNKVEENLPRLILCSPFESHD